MAEKEKRRATTFRTSKGTVVSVTYPDIYIEPGFVLPADVTSPAEMREALREELNQGLTVSGEAPLDFGRKIIPIDVGNYRVYQIANVVRCFNGDILAFCHAGSWHSGTDCDVIMFRSSDDGVTWTGPTTLARHTANYGNINPISGVTATGRILLMYHRRYVAAPISREKQLIYSDDHGVTWSAEISTNTIGLTFTWQNTVGQIIQNPQNYDLLYVDKDAAEQVFQLWRSTYAQNGLTWSLVGNVCSVAAATGTIHEPCLVWTPFNQETVNGRLVCGIRGDGVTTDVAVEGCWGFCFSDDAGATWSPIYWVRELPLRIGTNYTLFPHPEGIGLSIRTLRQHYGFQTLYTSTKGLFWHKTEGLLNLCPTSFTNGYNAFLPLRNGRILVIIPIEQLVGSTSFDSQIAGLYATVLSREDLLPRGKASCKILNTTSVGIGATTTLANCLEVDSEDIEALALTIRVTYGAGTAGVRVRIRSSPDAGNWDTDDYTFFDPSYTASGTIQKTVAIAADPRFMKVLVQNLDGAVATGPVKVWAELMPKYA